MRGSTRYLQGFGGYGIGYKLRPTLQIPCELTKAFNQLTISYFWTNWKDMDSEEIQQIGLSPIAFNMLEVHSHDRTTLSNILTKYEQDRGSILGPVLLTL